MSNLVLFKACKAALSLYIISYGVCYNSYLEGLGLFSMQMASIYSKIVRDIYGICNYVYLGPGISIDAITYTVYRIHTAGGMT